MAALQPKSTPPPTIVPSPTTNEYLNTQIKEVEHHSSNKDTPFIEQIL